jgi:hypothetical protein
LGIEVDLDGGPHQIVGIVGNVQQKKSWGRAQWGPVDAFAQAYGPVAQFSDKNFAVVHTWFSPNWIVRTRGNVAGLPEAMRRALQSVDPQLPFSSFTSMTELHANSLSQQRYLGDAIFGARWTRAAARRAWGLRTGGAIRHPAQARDGNPTGPGSN